MLLAKSNFAAFFASLLLAAFSHAQAVPQADVAFAYSHLFVSTSPGVNLDGASFSGAYNFDKWLSFIGDLGLYQGSQSGAGVTGTTYLVGTRISYHKLARVVPFIQGLAGGAHISRKLIGTSGSQNPFCYSFGAGVDIGLGRRSRVALRPQVEYVGFRYLTDGARASIGVMYRIGRRVE